MGSNIVPLLINGFFDNLSEVLRPARSDPNTLPVTYLPLSPGADVYPSPIGTYSSISICK